MDYSTAVKEIIKALDNTLQKMEDRNIESKEKTVEESFYAIETMAWAHAAYYFGNREIKEKLEQLKLSRFNVQQELDKSCLTLRELTVKMEKLAAETKQNQMKMKELAAETKINQKQLLIHKLGVLRREIRKTNEEISEAEEQIKKEAVLKISKTIVDHVAGFADVLSGFETGNPFIVVKDIASLAVSTWDDFRDLTEAVDRQKINKLEETLKQREKDLKKDEDTLRSITMKKSSESLA